MSLLKTEPPASVKSLEELFAIASAMEQEAATRYAAIAARMHREGDPALAEVFEQLATDEQGHLDSVVLWSEKTKGQAPDPALIRWQLPETFDDEGAATAHPRLLSIYKVLSMAVRNEERAFAFWSYVAAHAESPEIRQAAEAMAHEELGHVATLRRERRRAFHAEREHQPLRPDAASVSETAFLERRLADLLEPPAAAAPPAEARRLREFAAEARLQAEELERGAFDLPEAQSAHAIQGSPVAIAELLAERYLDAADGLRDEEALNRVQVLAGRAVNRLAWLRADLPELGNG
jgi:rubrerythrin